MLESHFMERDPELREYKSLRRLLNEKRKGGGHGLFLLCVWRTITNAIQMGGMSLLVLLK